MDFLCIVSFLFKKFFEFIYPKTCVICNEYSQDYICSKCERNVNLTRINLMVNVKDKYYQHVFFLFKYEGFIREKIIEYKFKDSSYLYKMFSKLILNTKEINSFINEYDIIIPVPISKKRLKERGYNQSELIAKQISKANKIPLQLNVLYKIKNIKPQSQMNKKQRLENIKNVYIVKNVEKIENKKILIIDDVYTTGSTVNECAKVLAEKGARIIGVLTIAKD